MANRIKDLVDKLYDVLQSEDINSVAIACDKVLLDEVNDYFQEMLEEEDNITRVSHVMVGPVDDRKHIFFTSNSEFAQQLTNHNLEQYGRDK